MRRGKYLIFIISLFIFWNVNAKNSLELVCNTPKMFKDGYTNCDVMLNYDGKVSFVEFNYESEMNVTFTKGEEAELNVSNNKVTLSYNNITPKNIKILNVKVTNNDDQLGEKKLTLKNIRITSEDVSYSLDNQEQIISVITEKDLSSDCNLSEITIDGVKLSNFKDNQYKYTGITSDKRVIFIDAKRSNENSQAMGLGNVMLQENKEKEALITVTAENGNKCVYNLGITYVKKEAVVAVEKSNNNNLDSLELYNKDKKIEFSFDNKKTDFNINVENDITELTVKAMLQDEKATFVSKFGPRDIKLNEGKNSILIKVSAENGDVKTYTLNITRDKLKSGDTTLKKLIINSVEVILNNNEFAYEITLPDVYDKTNVVAEANDKDAKIVYEDIDIKKNNILSIKVEAPNGDVSEYTITIDQDEEKEEDKPSFQKIDVTGYNLDFDINKKDYTLLVQDEVSKIDVKVYPSDIEMTVLDNGNLKNGSVVTVKVIDKDIERTYQIKIKKSSTKLVNILCYLFFIVAVIILLLSIRYRVKRK